MYYDSYDVDSCAAKFDTGKRCDEYSESDDSSDVEEDLPLDRESALKAVLRTALYHDGLARGLREAVKALDRREAHLCVRSSSCTEPAYVKLIDALCTEHNIPIIKVVSS